MNRIRTRIRSLSFPPCSSSSHSSSPRSRRSWPKGPDKDLVESSGFDAYMAKVLKDWNVPGSASASSSATGSSSPRATAIATTRRSSLYPDDASSDRLNTKLFTAVATGLLVDEGKLTWDKPVRESVPIINFYNDQLNATVTLRDMLSHRTGITRHDTIWYKSDFSRLGLFEASSAWSRPRPCGRRSCTTT